MEESKEPLALREKSVVLSLNTAAMSQDRDSGYSDTSSTTPVDHLSDATKFECARDSNNHNIDDSSIKTVNEVVLANKTPVKFEIRNAYQPEILSLCHWRHDEFGYRAHWDYLMDLYNCYPSGWIVAIDEKGSIIGSIFGMNISDKLAFGGVFAVKKPYRCQGIGGQLWKVRLNHIGARNFCVNAVASRVEPNQRLGMKVGFRLARYYGLVNSRIIEVATSILSIPYLNQVKSCNQNPLRLLKLEKENNISIINHLPRASTLSHEEERKADTSFFPSVVTPLTIPDAPPLYPPKLQEEDAETIKDPDYFDLLKLMIDYDTVIHTSSREGFIREAVSHYEHTTTIIALTTNPLDGSHQIVGYGMLRPRYVGYTIGPLYADSSDIARCIFVALLNKISTQEPVLIDTTIIEEDTEAKNDSGNGLSLPNEFRKRIVKNVLNNLGLRRECFLYRMYTKENVDLPLHKTYAVTSSEAFLL
ncbi:unnamed protein product [Gordionus sp. m RMFG-2023]|uniref:uncharacterized protein LOC135929777 n=1 Tax=Gordionus sp. m RMFG-2023 TaxID=3053472 RepID=UPI0030E3E232